jgi:hypothetical protein
MNDPFEAYSIARRLSNLGAEYYISELHEIGERIVAMEHENAALRTEIFALKRQGE